MHCVFMRITKSAGFFLLGLKVFFGNRYNGKTVATKVRHTVLNLSYLKARGLSFKVRKPIGSEPQLRRTGYA